MGFNVSLYVFDEVPPEINKVSPPETPPSPQTTEDKDCQAFSQETPEFAPVAVLSTYQSFAEDMTGINIAATTKSEKIVLFMSILLGAQSANLP
ncbi:MAG: hypothetical protein A4E66_02021 [Syntrophus sp. PtaB.Bin001]|nr:MAG: hypothetical protein A4E66_02021 [Syntrophus sp. PtaB.Bin001]